MKNSQQEFLPREELRRLGLNPKSMANLASRGKGPKYYKVGRRCLYRYEDLIAWITRHPVKTMD